MAYEDAAAFSAEILDAIEHKHMPPWPPNPNYQHYANERLLCDDEIALIRDWVNNDTPEGDPAQAPTPPTYTNTSQLGTPDLTVSMPSYTVTGSGGDIYRCFDIPTNLLQDKYITAIEVLPGNSSIVHHVLVFYDTSGDCAALDAADPGPGYENFGGVGSNNATFIFGWAPGASPYFFPSGIGMSLPANSHIVLQLHYPDGSQGETDQTVINFKLTNPAGMRNAMNLPALNHFTNMTNGPLFIAKNTVKTFYEEQMVPVKATILNVAPHMHLIGTSIKSYAVTPTNDTLKFIDIPHWDFHWQGGYSFKKPMIVPSGTILYAEAVYDNTENNPHNPSSPPKDVSAGEATTDEMMLVFFTFLTYQTGDEDINLDDNSDNHSCGALAQAKLFAEGPFTGTQMTTLLSSKNLLPSLQPFNTTPWNYDGNESRTTALPDATDWVLAELRRSSDTETGGILITQKAALLYKDGSLHDANGNNGVLFNVRDAGSNYYLALKPRAHLAAMSKTPILLPNNPPFDFTTAATQANGIGQLKKVGTKFCFMSGDFNGDGKITIADFNDYQAGSSLINVYHQCDANMDGSITVADFNKYKGNSSKIAISALRY